jgi:S-adenosylmethionine/arginine decarboxylase-like enzyme
MNEKKHWGYHVMLDCSECDIASATDPENIKAFSKELVEKIDMIAYGEPQIVHFADHSLDKAGWTLIQLIETSNITAHFIDNNGDAYIDVFSCKDFESYDVVSVVNKYFKPKSYRLTRLTRDATPIEVEAM